MTRRLELYFIIAALTLICIRLSCTDAFLLFRLRGESLTISSNIASLSVHPLIPNFLYSEKCITQDKVKAAPLPFLSDLTRKFFSGKVTFHSIMKNFQRKLRRFIKKTVKKLNDLKKKMTVFISPTILIESIQLK